MPSTKLNSTILARKDGRVHPGHLQAPPPQQVFMADEFIKKLQEKRKSLGIPPQDKQQREDELPRSTERRDGVYDGERRYNTTLNRTLPPTSHDRGFRDGVDHSANTAPLCRTTVDIPHGEDRVGEEFVGEEQGCPLQNNNTNSSERWRKSQLSLSICCPIALVLMIIVMILGVKLATNVCPIDCIAESNHNAEATKIPPHTMHTKFVKLLFPDNFCGGCNLRMGIDNNSAIVSANHSVHFFSFQNDDWERDETIDMKPLSSADMPVAISGDVAVVGDPHNNAGLVHVFEKDMGKWGKLVVLEAGWMNNDLEFEAGIVSNFGRTVAVDKDLIAVGAVAKLSDNVGAFFFKKTQFGWTRKALLPPDSDRQTKANHISVRNGLALVSLSDPPYQVESDGSVYLFQMNASGAMSRIQKLDNKDCKLYGSLAAAILDDGSIIISCISDHDDIAMHYNIASTDGNGHTQYVLEQAFQLSNELKTPNAWFAVDAASPTFAFSNDGIAHIFHKSSGLWRESAVISTGGSIAISDNNILVETGDNVGAYTLESKSC